MKTSLRQAATPQRRSRPRVSDRPKRPSSGQHPRRRFLTLAAGAAALPAVSRIARAQTYPSRPVRIIVCFPAGGSTDLAARLISQSLSERLRQQFFVENRPGAAGNIGTQAVVQAPADGYTLLMAADPNAINATVYEHLNFNFIRDTVPIAGIMSQPVVMLVNPFFPAATVPAFISYAKSSPGKINMASAGVGTPPHVLGELFKMMAGVNMLHVPYRGDSPAIADLLGGQVQVYFTALSAAIEYVRAGKLRALAVTTATRSPALPNVPTMGEFLRGYEATNWWGMVAPRNTSAEIVSKLNMEINAGLVDSKLKARMADFGGTPLVLSPAEFGKFVADETEKWAKVVRAANIKAE
jgi:tripartite-type tricarboxylate transporter receptor subunit TctC